MENGRCSRGLLRAYPPPRVSFPTQGKGVGSGRELGSPPLPHTGVGLSLESPPTAGHARLSMHSPVTGPATQVSPGREALPCCRQEWGAPGQVQESWGERCGV